jgi:hypothetical protein
VFSFLHLYICPKLLFSLKRNNFSSFWNVAKIGDSERLRPEELNQQNIEALVAENNLVTEPLKFLFLFHC